MLTFRKSARAKHNNCRWPADNEDPPSRTGESSCSAKVSTKFFRWAWFKGKHQQMPGQKTCKPVQALPRSHDLCMHGEDQCYLEGYLQRDPVSEARWKSTNELEQYHPETPDLKIKQDIRSWRPSCVMSTESIKIVPLTGSIMRNSANRSCDIPWDKHGNQGIIWLTDDLPAPVRPQTPIFSLGFWQVVN